MRRTPISPPGKLGRIRDKTDLCYPPGFLMGVQENRIHLIGGALVIAALKKYQNELEPGAIITMEPQRGWVRIFPLSS